MKLNTNIKNFRIFRGITQQELAARLGKSKNVVSNWERGDNSPNPDEIEKLCSILEVTPNQIFGWDPLPEYIEFLHLQEKKRKELYELEARQVMMRSDLDKLTEKIAKMKQELI